ncbi:hypothetical protein [Sphingomonas sp.]|uniref:hypothetical protein n=1 Tax=Sphingomonas sp. TaxID=28214 RepID=UPI001B1A132D|nr:hypothetical protein [Sphingomonas sp.]MBO9714417.1 hypothetical protein [Sphingomonas sp.]
MSQHEAPLSRDQAEQLLADPWTAASNWDVLPVGESVPARAIKALAPGLEVALAADTPTPAPAPTLAELGELSSSSYDLSVNQAGQLGIPVIGSVSGGASRRVVVLEWSRFKEFPEADGGIARYGFTVRFCLTVNKWNADLKVSLPFLSAQAELGNIQATWKMEVRGLAGPKINAAVILPQPLSVETFVIARQSLETIVAAINDPTTSYIPGLMISRTPPDTGEQKLRKSAVEAYALYAIYKGRPELRAESDLPSKQPGDEDILRGVYEQLGVETTGETPAQSIRETAKRILNGLSVGT